MGTKENYEKLEDYQKGIRKKILFPSKELLALCKEIDAAYGTYYNTTEIQKVIDDYKKKELSKPSDLFKKNLKKLLGSYVPKQYVKEFLYIIDELNAFQYSYGYKRRSVRSSDYSIQLWRVFEIIKGYEMLGFYNCPPEDFITNRLEEEKLEFKRKEAYRGTVNGLEYIIAAALDNGNKRLEQEIHDLILSENNTNIVSVPIIRGILLSKSHEMHKLLGDFLLAARLQEGVRQAICENMDCGRAEAFKTLLNVILENNLIRFASVKRAVATWIGICDVEHMDRISGKLLELIALCVEDASNCKKMLQGNDSIEISVALWAKGFYEIADAVSEIKEILNHGSRQQKLVVSYYNQTLQFYKFMEIGAKKAIIENKGDYELLAAFLPSYFPEMDWEAGNIVYGKERLGYYRKLSLAESFTNEQEAREHYRYLTEVYENMPKKTMLFSPCIFPWYSVELSKSKIAKCLLYIAYMLQDEEITDHACALLKSLSAGNGYASGRSHFTELLLHEPKTQKQLNQLTELAADKESDTRKTAFKLLKNQKLGKEQYLALEEMLKYKTNDIRANIITLLYQQPDEALLNCLERCFTSKKEEVVTGALDLLMQLSKDKAREKCLPAAKALLVKIKEPTAKEKILIDEINKEQSNILEITEAGYGLYDPEEEIEIKRVETDAAYLASVFDIEAREIEAVLKSLEELIEENKHKEYKTAYGEEELLGNHITSTIYAPELSAIDTLPFPELWKQFYKDKIKNFKTLLNLQVVLERYAQSPEEKQFFYSNSKILFGTQILDVSIKDRSYIDHMGTIIHALYYNYVDKEMLFQIAKCAYRKILDEVPENTLACRLEERYAYQQTVYFVHLAEVAVLLSGIAYWNTEEEFLESFLLRFEMGKKHNFIKVQKYSDSRLCSLGILAYVKAYLLGAVSRQMVYKAVFEYEDTKDALNALSVFFREKPTRYDENIMRPYIQKGVGNSENPIFIEAGSIYLEIVEIILSVELKRGDTPTIFSNLIYGINYIYGADRFVQILSALGNETLDRGSFGYSSNTSRKVCLSNLLQACYPNKEDNGDILGRLLENTDITESRLVESAMYAAQWMDIIGSYLGWDGFQSGCYYFIAHMNERFNEKQQAMIAKYTPLSEEALNLGAFDINWFREAYRSLGEQRFQILYKSAKYISDGSKHARARKYADAVNGKMDADTVKQTITEKRNKDLLMAYALIPLKDESDILKRYEYLQQFLKESRQFGAQRRASEAAAAGIAMENLAINAGFSDVTRLTLNMEAKLLEENKGYFEAQDIGGIEILIQMEENGKPEIRCIKNGKVLKSIPAAIKKDAYVLQVKEVHKKLKEQHLRTKQMLEQAMEDGTVFYFSELCTLAKNPIAEPLIKKLVLVGEDGIGFLEDGRLVDLEQQVIGNAENAPLRIAHCFDLYRMGVWHEFQHYLFKNGIKQPFKQVFRELYVKTEEELEKEYSLRFAGNQIQPKKTIGCLKGRRWVLDYENGLQKIYYQENIVATIYALADWFSPSDIEAPTLEWVCFYDRKTFRSLKLREIPDIIFSEVMRDVDLAVSVAHAGGVDPETSHSTVDMRKVIVELNLPLFKLTNVSFEGSHAVIHGTRGNYTIHLGSGVIHQEAGAQIHVLPVHSQSRGRLFLPFVDEDPKTAEIMSKIVLFAEDKKIKDPYVLSQLK